MEDTRLIGRVNWFDSKKGYGFITVMTKEQENTDKDIFIHYTSIIESSYKKVFPGEYVEFELENRGDRICCVNVTGPMGGPLLIENENHRYKVLPKGRNETNETNETNDVPDNSD
tara:strand:+ start:72 stop:416 length:345 start_codon:yes stop_codon:yes gene_type:complete